MNLSRESSAAKIPQSAGIDSPVLVSIDDSWRSPADVGRGTDQQKKNEQEGLEVEQSGLSGSVSYSGSGGHS
jgi:hypothetical protein